MPTWKRKIHDLWKADQIHGIELVFGSCLLALRYISFSYWSKDVLLKWLLEWRDISDQRSRRVWRDNLIDNYCLLQLLVLFVILCWFAWSATGWFVATYILFEIYLNLFSIFFLSRQRRIGPPKPSDRLLAVNEPSTSVERSIILIFVNVLQVTVSFGIFYKKVMPGLTPSGAFANAVLVLGTVGTPSGAPPLLVASQIGLDFLLVALILGSFVGQAGPFAKR